MFLISDLEDYFPYLPVRIIYFISSAQKDSSSPTQHLAFTPPKLHSDLAIPKFQHLLFPALCGCLVELHQLKIDLSAMYVVIVHAQRGDSVDAPLFLLQWIASVF